MPNNNKDQSSQNDVDIYQKYNKEIDELGLSSDALYDKISDSPGDFSNYYNALKNKSGGKNTPEIQQFLSKVNSKFSEDFGFVYDPTTAGGLHPIPKDDPRFSKILDYSKKYSASVPVQADKNKPDNIPTDGKHSYGNGSFGVGNESSGEYDWWKPKKYTRTLTNVTAKYDSKDQVRNEKGEVVFQEPGWRFKKNYSDGTEANITESDYNKSKHYNNLPAEEKEKHELYSEEVELDSLDDKNKEKALKHIDLQNKAKEK
jgi:hypothetical protein